MPVLLLLLLVLLGCSDDPIDPPPEEVRLDFEPVASGLEQPLVLTAPPGDARLFVVERPGRIRVIEDGQLLADPFLDISDRVTTDGEGGLLGLAFHPRHEQNGDFYVDYTGSGGHTRVERYTVSPDPGRADPASAKLILTVEQPGPTHNGGMIAFGPDGMLYIALGDGIAAPAGDPYQNAQNPGTLLGSLLRIDVDGGDPYGIPPDNPFIDDPDARAEIWAYGLRNPWRFGFDRQNELLFVADVGQSIWEEVNVAPLGEVGAGLNYGWPIMEGNTCFNAESCDPSDLVLPVLQYPHAEGGNPVPNCAILGGPVYRGGLSPSLRGHYFYSDYCRGWLRSFRYVGGEILDAQQWDLPDLGMVLSLGEDAAGELYMLTVDGRVMRVVPEG